MTAKIHASRWEEVPPKASAMVESLRDIGYSLPTALSDLIDNSLTAHAQSIELLSDIYSETPAIGILDNGDGMTKPELLEAMRAGSTSPLAIRAPSDLGRFGLGLKTASFSQCRRLSVLTRQNGQTTCAVWDLDTVVKRDQWLVELPEDFSEIPWSDRIKGNGTLVVWQKLDRLVGIGRSEDQEHLVRQLDESVDHIQLVFHRFLSGTEKSKGRVRILLNGRALEPFDPFHSHNKATQFHQEERFALRDGEIRIQPVTLPHHDKVTRDEWNLYGRKEGYVRNQGFYLYRNRRLIVYGTWFGLAKQLELTKLCRVQIDIPTCLDSEWKVDVKKASAQPPRAVRQRLLRIIEQVGIPSKRAYTKRGSRLATDNRVPVWERSQNKNVISYGIDAEHPLLTSFVNQLDLKLTHEFKSIINLIEASLPIEALFADVSESSNMVQGQKPTSEDFKKIVTAVWQALGDSGIPYVEVQRKMQSADPFRTRWKETEQILEAIQLDTRNK